MGRRKSGTAIGREGEGAAARYLEANGYLICARNVRFRSGEIDLVAIEGGDLVFVEVKTRTGTAFGTAEEAVTRRKQQQLIRLAELYLATQGGGQRPCRFDVVTVLPDATGGWRCHLIREAFSA